MSPALRNATEDDLAKIRALVETLIHVFDSREEPGKAADVKQECLQLNLPCDGTAVVAEDAGAIIGYGCLIGKEPIYTLSHLFVAATYQQQGIGTQLLAELTRGKNVRHITVKSSKTAVPFYEKSGFRSVEGGYQSTVLSTLTRAC